MIPIVVRHWFYLLWENPFSVLISNLTLVFLLGFGFGAVAFLPLPAPILIGLGVSSLITTILYAAGLTATVGPVSLQKAWSLATPWSAIPQNLGSALLGFLSFLFLSIMWQVSIPSYLATPDIFPPEDPIVLSVIKDGGRYRLNWRDPEDADLGFLRLRIRLAELNKEFQGRIDVGMGTYLIPEFEGRAELLLQAVDQSGNASDGLEISIENDAWQQRSVWDGRSRNRPKLRISGIHTDGLNLSWETDEEGSKLDKEGDFRLLSADTRDGLPEQASSPGASGRILLDWSRGILRLAVDHLGWDRGRWYQVQARWPDGTLVASEAIYRSTLGIGNIVVAGILVVVFVWLLISLPFWQPWKRLNNRGWFSSLRESQVYLIRNLGFALWASLGGLIWLVTSALLLTSFPGLLGLGLWYHESLRMQLKAEEWLKNNPEASPEGVPWQRIFAEERQLWSHRKLKQWLMPWR